MAESSFDVESEFDLQELRNAIDQATREVRTRYDLKSTNSMIELQDDQIVITSSDEFMVKQVYEVVQSKAQRRGLSLKVFMPGKIESALGGRTRQPIELRSGLTSDQCKDLSKRIRDQFKKVKTQIQGDTLRVTDKSKDQLQEVIQYLKQLDFEAPLQITNYR
jgi:hypothetical protein